MDDKVSGGAKCIIINIFFGEFQVWIKWVGNNLIKKVFFFYGGLGVIYEYFEVFDSYFFKEGIEYYYYDQLGFYFSDQLEDILLWNIFCFVEEVEQVCQVLGLNKDNFYIFGYSWGGILGIEYVLKYQENFKGLIIFNMMFLILVYVKYVEEELVFGLFVDVLVEICKLEAVGQYMDECYLELVEMYYYLKYVLCMFLEEWLDLVICVLININYGIYFMMQGLSEFGVVGDVILKEWDWIEDFVKIIVLIFFIGVEYDIMDFEFMEMMVGKLFNGFYYYCLEGVYWAMYDDVDNYFKGVIDFVNEVDVVK